MSERIAFGAWLRLRRNEQGIKPDELAERIGCSSITLRKIEAGERRPSRQIAELLAGYFRIPSDEQEAFITFARSKQSAFPDEALNDEATSRSPWRGAHLRQTNLPALLTPLVGRKGNEEEVRAQLLQPKVRLLTLTGAPGIGKTRLAMQIASNLVDHFEDGVFFVDLAPVSDPDAVLSTAARALGLKEEQDQPIGSVLLEHLRERRALLLLDNFEQVLDAASEVVKLMESCPWLKVLATSREALHVRGERRYSVPPLEVPSGEWRVVSSEFRVASSSKVLPTPYSLLATVPSVELFMERAQAVASGFALTEENAEDVAAVCIGLEGLPLAIELAASRAERFSPGEMRAGLVSRLKLLTEGARDLPARHRTLRAAIEWSYNLLEVAEQRLFRRLGVFVGGFTQQAAEMVCNGDGNHSLAGLLASLADKNLVRGEWRNEVLRYGVLETLREYALELLEEIEEEVEDTRRSHANYYMALAEEASPKLRGPQQFEWLKRLEGDLDNIRAALGWAEQSGEAEIGLRLAEALWWFWELGGYTKDGLSWSLRMLSLAQGEELLPVRARALTGAGVLAYKISDYGMASTLLGEGLALSQRFNDKAGVADALRGLGLLARIRGEHAAARQLLEESLQIRRQLGDKVAVADATYALGVAVLHQSDYPQARLLLRESLALYKELGDLALSVYVMTWLGDLARCEEDFVEARLLYEERIALSKHLWANPDQMYPLHNLGHVAHYEGDHEQATELFIESLELSLDLGDTPTVGACLAGLAGIAASEKQPERAAWLFGAADKLGAHLDQADLIAYNRNMAATLSQLSQEAYVKAWTEGQAMTMEEAVKYALEG